MKKRVQNAIRGMCAPAPLEIQSRLEKRLKRMYRTLPHNEKREFLESMEKANELRREKQREARERESILSNGDEGTEPAVSGEDRDADSVGSTGHSDDSGLGGSEVPADLAEAGQDSTPGPALHD